eukprot:505788_1
MSDPDSMKTSTSTQRHPLDLPSHSPSPSHQSPAELSQSSLYSADSDVASQASNSTSTTSDMDLCSLAEFVPSPPASSRFGVRPSFSNIRSLSTRGLAKLPKLRLNSLWSSSPRVLSENYLVNLFGTQSGKIRTIRDKSVFKSSFDLTPKVQIPLPTPLSVEEISELIPPEYFDDGFRTFFSRTFLELTEVEMGSDEFEDVFSHLDVVEVNMVQHIQLRSKSLFGALSMFVKLYELAQDTWRHIEPIRTHIHKVRDESITEPFKVIRNQRKLRNAQRLQHRLRLIIFARRAPTKLKTLVMSSDYLGATVLINSVYTVYPQRLPVRRFVFGANTQLDRGLGAVSRRGNLRGVHSLCNEARKTRRPRVPFVDHSRNLRKARRYIGTSQR